MTLSDSSAAPGTAGLKRGWVPLTEPSPGKCQTQLWPLQDNRGLEPEQRDGDSLLSLLPQVWQYFSMWVASFLGHHPPQWQPALAGPWQGRGEQRTLCHDATKELDFFWGRTAALPEHPVISLGTVFWRTQCFLSWSLPLAGEVGESKFHEQT